MKALVVDDSAVIRKVARRMLEGIGYSVTEADDGATAQGQVASDAPDVVLLDWNMPTMDGLSFLSWLRRQALSQPKVVFCTTESDLDHVERALAAGADEFIFKPFDEMTLRSKLSMVGLAS